MLSLEGSSRSRTSRLPSRCEWCFSASQSWEVHAERPRYSYTQRIQPWIPVIERRSALVVREKSPFLFHVILLVTNCALDCEAALTRPG